MNLLPTSAAKSALCASLFAVLVIGVPLDAAASAIRTDAAFTANTLARNDDGSTGLVPISFELCFFGRVLTQLYVNNNGNVTFLAPLPTFTPSLSIVNTPIIAPFFADVDTRNLASGVTQYGSGLITTDTGVHQAFGVNWINVGYYNSLATHLNTFQLVLIQRSDTGNSQNFDIEFNYETITWESGQASGSNADGNCNNLPNCVSALVGYGNGLGTTFVLPGSLVHGAFMNGGPSALGDVSINSNNVVGKITTNCRSCAVAPPINQVPEPATLALFGLALGGLALRRRRNS